MPEQTPAGQRRSGFGRPLVTAAEMDRMTPDQLDRLHTERFVQDLDAVPADLLAELLDDDAQVHARAQELDQRRDAAERQRQSRAS
jgi:hypothetical protein